jgi:iron complex transport system ATP-binding protein
MLTDAAYRYGDEIEAVRGIDLEVPSGCIVGVIGPNGAGKSTLLRLAIGQLRPDRGRALIDGGDAHRMNPVERARRIAYVPQTARALFPFTVAEIVAMGRHPHRGPFGPMNPEDRESVRWAMEATGTVELERRAFGELSGGEAQRVVLARALAQRTPALALDEPTASLDLYYQAAIYGLLVRLNRDRGLTVVVVTHDVNLAAEHCQVIVGVREGRKLFEGPPESVVTPERIEALYGVIADVMAGPRGPIVRARLGGEAAR